jgi:hypothetical protein
MIDILVCVLNMCSFQAGLRGTGADVTGLVVLLTCPLGPDPLASRGLAAVLAQAGTAGAVSMAARSTADRRGSRRCG